MSGIVEAAERTTLVVIMSWPHINTIDHRLHRVCRRGRALLLRAECESLMTQADTRVHLARAEVE